MNEQAQTAAKPRSDPMRPLRYLYRTPLLLLLAIIAVPLALFVFSPPARGMTVKGEPLAHWMQRWWSGRLVRCFGFRIHRSGEPLPGAIMFVANHVSWLDIELMHSQRVMAFVAKEEISRWPLIGWLATRAGTIYHRRGSTHSLGAVQEQMADRLRNGMAVGIFPEGGTGPGDCVRTFHARIFQAATDTQATIQPVGLCYGYGNTMDLSVPFGPKENFMSNFLRLLGGPPMDATVYFLDPVPLSDEGRRQTAEAARQRIAAALHLPAE